MQTGKAPCTLTYRLVALGFLVMVLSTCIVLQLKLSSSLMFFDKGYNFGANPRFNVVRIIDKNFF